MLSLRSEDGAVILPVKVVPGASRSRYVGEWDGHAKLTVVAPAEKGKANKAVVELLAKTLGISRRRISIIAGASSATKKIRIEGVTPDQVSAALKLPRS